MTNTSHPIARWPVPRYMIMLWLPIACMYVLPIIMDIATTMVHGSPATVSISYYVQLFLFSFIGDTIVNSPFFVLTVLTQRDRQRNVPFREGVVRWALGIVPMTATTGYLFFEVGKASILRAPGFSTASIGLIILLPLNFALLYIGRAVGKLYKVKGA
jgi:hypothetical protein